MRERVMTYAPYVGSRDTDTVATNLDNRRTVTSNVDSCQILRKV